MKMKLLGILLAFAPAVFAADDNNCEDKLVDAIPPNRYEVIPSERMPQDAEKYRAYMDELFGPGGVVETLGIPMTGQVIEFVQGRDLNALVSGSAGGYPIRFYLDGAAVIQANRPRNGFPLEVVYPGPTYQHGFYRDDNPVEQQKSIIDHVVGHNNFAYASGLEHYRAGQGLLATRDLDNLLADVFRSFDKDDVQRYYLFSQTLVPLMDWHTPYYQPSSVFEPQMNLKDFDPLGRKKVQVLRHPLAPTENVLPAFAANIAPYEPTWKREILELLHSSMAFRPALVHTQIMNEGWASIMQEIIPRYTKDSHSFQYWFNASQVMQAEDEPNLSNPYSLGVFAWRRIRERFEKRPEIKALPDQLAKDRAFFKMANEEIIGPMTDFEFLLHALDQEFVERHKLAVVRRLPQEEWDQALPPPQPQPGQPPPAQWEVVSRDAEEVAHAIIDRVLKPKYSRHPRVKLVDFNRPATGEVELVIDDPVGNELAIAKETLGPSLYALANIIGKPVSLECRIAGQMPEPEPPSMFRWPPPPPKPQMPPLHHVRVVVSPSGELNAFEIRDQGDDEIEMQDSYIRAELTKHLKAYIDDLYLDDLELRESVIMQSQSLRSMAEVLMRQATDEKGPTSSLLIHAPNAAGAVHEYQVMLQRRMIKSLELAAQGKRKIHLVGQTPRLKVLPSVVNIEFDPQYSQLVADQSEDSQGGVGTFMWVNRTSLPVSEDTLLVAEEVTQKSPFGEHGGSGRGVGGIGGRKGDRFWGPGKPPGGAGSAGRKPGENPNDPSWVDLPVDLYARFLGERVKLPVLNRKPGLSRVKKTKPGRKRNSIFGEWLVTDIMQNAFSAGYGKVYGTGKDPLDNPEETYQVGLENLKPRDFVVKSKTVAKKPDVKAVVTFVLDASMSTYQYMEAFKRFVYDMKILISQNYKGVAFRYVVFDTQAHLMKNEQEFFRFELGGGTSYKVGLERTKKLFEDEYPRSQYDRYTFVMGDLEDIPEPTIPAFNDLLDVSEFIGVVAGLSGWSSPDFSIEGFIRQRVSEVKSVGLTVLKQDGSYDIENMREVLRNDDEEQ